MSQDALERLRDKAKPTVKNRDLSPFPTNTEVSSIDPDISPSSSQDLEISTVSNTQVSSSDDELNLSSMKLETKQSTIRLEKGLSQRLSQKCLESQISREVFLEALFVQFEKNQSLQSRVLKEARQRDEQRRKIANYRRAKSMIEKFGTL